MGIEKSDGSVPTVLKMRRVVGVIPIKGDRRRNEISSRAFPNTQQVQQYSSRQTDRQASVLWYIAPFSCVEYVRNSIKFLQYLYYTLKRPPCGSVCGSVPYATLCTVPVCIEAIAARLSCSKGTSVLKTEITRVSFA